MRLIFVLLLALILVCLFSFRSNIKLPEVESENYTNPYENKKFAKKWRESNYVKSRNHVENFTGGGGTPGPSQRGVIEPTIPEYGLYDLDIYGVPKDSYSIVRNVAYIAVVPTDEVHIFRTREEKDIFQSHHYDRTDDAGNYEVGKWNSDNDVYYVGKADVYDKIHYFQCPYYPQNGERLLFYTRNTPDDPFNEDNKSVWEDPTSVDGKVPYVFKSVLACHVYYNYNWYVSNPKYFKIVAIEDYGAAQVTTTTPLYKDNQPMHPFSKGYLRLGCYEDNGQMSLMNESLTSDSSDRNDFEQANNLRFDHVSCRNYAKDQGKTLFAVKNNGKCYTWVDDGSTYSSQHPTSSSKVADNWGDSLAGSTTATGLERCKQGLASLNDVQAGIYASDLGGNVSTDPGVDANGNTIPYYQQGYLRNFEGITNSPMMQFDDSNPRDYATYADKLDPQNHNYLVHYRTSSDSKTLDIHMVNDNPNVRVTGRDGYFPEAEDIYGDATSYKVRNDDTNGAQLGRLKDGALTIQPDVGGPPRRGTQTGETELAMAYGNNLYKVYIVYQLDIGNDAKLGEQEICPDPQFLEFNPAGCTNYFSKKDDCVNSMRPGFYVNDKKCEQTLNDVINDNQYNNVQFFTIINRFFSILYSFSQNLTKLKKDRENDPVRFKKITEEKLEKFVTDMEGLRDNINTSYRSSVETACELMSMVHGTNPDNCSRDIPSLDYRPSIEGDQGDRFFNLIVNANYDFIPSRNPSQNEQNKRRHKSLRDKLNADLIEFVRLGKVFVFKANEMFNACSCQGALGQKCSPC